MRWVMKGSAHNDKEQEIHFKGTKEEIDALDAFLVQQKWIRMKEGKLLSSDTHEEPPHKTPDPELFPHFNEGETVLKYRKPGKKNKHADHPFYVQHIMGYSSGIYEERAKEFTQAGFSCLRSKRGEDGKYWEIWYLSGAWSFKPEVLSEDDQEKFHKAKYGSRTKHELILEWIKRKCVGEIETEGDHWGLSID